MAVKTRTKKGPVKETPGDFPEIVEQRFKLILKTISWIVAISFLLIITLPIFDFYLLDFFIKVIFYLCVFSLLFFAVLEFFGTSIKKAINRLSG